MVMVFDKDASTLEKCLCLDLQNVNVLSLDFHIAAKPSSDNMLIYSTDSGTVNVFTFNEDRMNNFAIKRKGLVEHIMIEKDWPATKTIKDLGNIWKRKAHQDWAMKTQFIQEIKSLISCSPDPRNSLVVAELNSESKWIYHNCSICKGVNVFVFCMFPVSIVTGGTDRNLRIWNPHRLNHPSATLKGHSAPIVDISINDIQGQIISISLDKALKIWDIKNQNCLQTISNFTTQRPDDTLSKCFFFGDSNGESIITLSNCINKYKMIKNMVFLN
jgi:WD40 repeat protein